MKNVGFFTGSRSEYGLSVSLLKELQIEKEINLLIYPNGLHLLNAYGNTVNEIKKDGFNIGREINTYTEKGKEKIYELTDSINKIFSIINNETLDVIIVCGDRIEAYATALAAHFANIPLFHIGGGVITKGAIDNIYRFNISNLATAHFVTCKSAYERLSKLDIIDPNNLYLSGSTAIDLIIKMQRNPIGLNRIVEDLDYNFCIMTFHPVTKAKEKISELMDYSIQVIINHGINIVITYPNNDIGSLNIQDVINKWKNHKNIFVKKSLGSKKYFSLIKYSKFIIGNSSSGVIEVPYFNKISFNIGSRQDGREKDKSVVDIKAKKTDIKNSINKYVNNDSKLYKCANLYGSGSSNRIILNVIKKKLRIN